jgi:hypothetical protein
VAQGLALVFAKEIGGLRSSGLGIPTRIRASGTRVVRFQSAVIFAAAGMTDIDKPNPRSFHLAGKTRPVIVSQK